MKRVLLIEDRLDLLEELGEAFTSSGVEVIKCSTRETALSAVAGDIPFDAVVLDWYFVLEEDSALSKQILRELRGAQFRPVFIYTGEMEDYKNTPDEEIDYPKNLLSAYPKTDTIETLKHEISNKIFSNYSLQVAETYRIAIARHLERLFFDLNELRNVDLAMVLTKTLGTGDSVDWSSDLILNLLHRALVGDKDFIESVIGILQSAGANNAGTNEHDRKRIANRILYYHSPSSYIRNGDIVTLQQENGATIGLGVIVTPDCDLEQRKTRYIELVELRRMDDAALGLNTGQQARIKQFNHDSLHLFPAIHISDSLVDFVAVLKSKVVVKETNDAPKYPSASERLLYSHAFLHHSQPVKLIPICSITNPYKAEFLQKLHSNNSRVGIPDIKDLWAN